MIDEFPLEARFTSGRATLIGLGDGVIRAIARGGHRGTATSFKSRVQFSDISEIPPISALELVQAIRPRSRPAAESIVHEKYGLFSETSSDQVREAMRTNYPEASEVLEAVLKDEPNWMSEDPQSAQLHRMESDAVNIALEIAGLDRGQALDGLQRPLTPHHVDLAQTTRPNEDSIVVDDLDFFPGWKALRNLRPSGRQFVDAASGRKLTVVLANKTGIERTTGVDLLYFIHEYRSFVLVQYKRLSNESGGKSVRVDAQFEAELERMRVLEARFRRPGTATKLMNYRLADVICFFKICDADQEVQVSDLSRGKYIDLNTWRAMDRSGLAVGPRGGRTVRYDQIPRYFANSEFAELVSEGWVGSAPSTARPLVEYMMSRYEEGVALLLGSLELGQSYRRPDTGPDFLFSRPVVPET